MYTLPALKNKTLPTISTALLALKKADNDDPSARDVRPLMAILSRIMEVSPRLRGLALTRRVAVTSFDWSLVPTDPDNGELAMEAEQRCRHTINRILNRHAQTPLFGAMAVQLTWDLMDGRHHPKVLKRFHPTEIIRWGDDRSEVCVLEGDTNRPTRINASIAPDRQNWILDYDEDSVADGGILRSLIFHEILRDESLQEWANFNRKIKGLILGKHREHAGDEEIDQAVETLKGLTQHNFSISSDAVTFEFVKLVDQLGAHSFSDFKKTLETDESIAIVGQANTTELPNNGGSRAALQILQMISADIHYADLQRCEEMINGQLLLFDYQLNVDQSAIVLPYRFRFNMAEERDAEKAARTVREALDAGISLRKSEVYEQLGYSVPSDGDEVFAGRTPSPTLPL